MKATMRKKEKIERKELASFLKTTPEALQRFEDSYQYYAIDQNPETGNLFDEQKNPCHRMTDSPRSKKPVLTELLTNSYQFQTS